MGCLPWVVGGIAWAIATAITDSGLIGFAAGLVAAIIAGVVVAYVGKRNTPKMEKPPYISTSQQASYVSHCWYCDSPVSSTGHRKCAKCGWYICNKCGECGCRYKRFEEARKRRISS